jgi:hypothetical protein
VYLYGITDLPKGIDVQYNIAGSYFSNKSKVWCNLMNDATPISNDFSGIWRSDYTYHNSDQDKDFLSQHYVRLYVKDNQLIAESVSDLNESYMLARFSVDGDIVTGSWQEVTDPQGNYQGTIYHGAAQLILSEDKKSLKGKWVGFGKNMEVKTGPWEFVYIGADESALADLPKIVTQ